MLVTTIIYKPACGERDIIVTTTVQCLCVRVSVRACVCEFVWAITSTIVDGFQKSSTQVFSIMCRCAIYNISSGRRKVKVTLEGQIFV